MKHPFEFVVITPAHDVASNNSINVFDVFRLLPVGVTNMSIEVIPAGTVNVYQTSYLVPAHEPAIPELVALNKVPDVFTQLVFGVSDVGVEQSSDCADEIFENKIKAINAVVVRVIGDMVLQGF